MKQKFEKIRDAVRPLFVFTPSQVRGILWLLPLLAVFGVIIGLANKPRFEKSFLELADSAAVAGAREPRNSVSPPSSPDSLNLFTFDPNTATLQEFCSLGLDARTAAGIIKYRERGKRFEIPEDLAVCYGVTLADYTRLEPYIRIGDAYRLKPSGNSKAELPANDLMLNAFDPNELDAAGFVAIGFSQKQADVIVRYRQSVGGFKSKEDFAKCYVVSEAMMARIGEYVVVSVSVAHQYDNPEQIVPQPVEINGADSVALREIRGVGDVLVVRIIEYRARLGGFAHAGQLAEVRGMYDDNLHLIREQIWVDSCGIQKIDVNFATHKTLVEQMGKHPYVTGEILRKLLKNRQLKGGWRTIGEMVEQDILTNEEAAKLSPYLLFRSE